jgi:hypothetical protein
MHEETQIFCREDIYIHPHTPTEMCVGSRNFQNEDCQTFS